MPKTENWKPNTQIQIEAKLVLGYITTSQKQLTKARVKAKKLKPRDEANPRESSDLGWCFPEWSPTWMWNVFHFEHATPTPPHPESSSSAMHFNETKNVQCLPWHNFHFLRRLCLWLPQLDPLDLVQANGKSIDNYGHGQWSDSLSSTDWPCLICIARASRLLPLPLVTSFFFLAVVYETE